MSSNELSYRLLPADRYANTNFRHAFFSLAFLETLLTSCSTSLCMTLSICIYTRKPFILLHTSYHPFIQASIFMIASVTQLFKLFMLVVCTAKIILHDGEIFLASAKVDIRPDLQIDQCRKSPNDVARRCFKSRQRYIRGLRRVMKFYPLIQLLCGSLSLAFWCTSDERHRLSQGYYHKLQHTQGPSNIVFLFYLIAWSVDLLATPFFLLIATWHYSRVDWQMQLLAAQETMDRNIDAEVGRRASRRRASTASNKRKHKSMGPQAELFRAASPPFVLGSLQQHQRQHQKDLKRQKTKSKDVHTTQAPLSVPVSPSSLSSSCKSSMFSSLRDATASDRETASHGNVEKRLMRLTASINRRASSLDLSTSFKEAATKQQEQRHVSAYLNVEGGNDVDDENMAGALSEGGEGSESFRICIQTDESSMSMKMLSKDENRPEPSDSNVS